MAIDIKSDLVGNLEPPTIVLAKRNGDKLGQLDVDPKSIELSDKFNDASEISFILNKYVDGKLTNLWDKVVDFKLIWCKEWDMWFEITVELDEETKTVKTVLCTQLGQAELSQIMLYNIEINTEEDIERDDYKIAILYDEGDPESSLLNRLLKDKAPHYSIAYVSPTIAKIQRSFSFDGTSIKDAFDKIAEEIGCLFVYNSGSNEYGKPQRTISVYDLQQNCNGCGYRGEFTDKCPKCGSKNILYGYGEDTLIFVTSDELASGGIQLTTDTDSVKNCFKLEAGDDLMTATIRNCNPNGTDYIWRFSDSIKEDMSQELVSKLKSYDEEYKYRYNDSISNIDETLLNDYNELVKKYSVYNKDLQKISTPIVGYPSLMNAYYNAIDLALYLKSGLMPSVEMSKTNSKEQASLLTSSSLSPVAVGDVSIASLATLNSAVLAMAKTIVRPTYKVQVKSSEIYDEDSVRYWKGNFTITNYSDEEDVADSDIISVKVNDDVESFIKQKLEKALNKENTEDMSITGLFDKEYDDFCNELKKYALNPLISFRDACQSCMDILIEQGVGDNNTWSDNIEGSDGNLYEKLYTPYYNKLIAIEAEIKVRENEVNVITGVYDVDGNLVTKGLQIHIEESRNQIHKALNFEDYLGNELWLEFCCYRREDKYSNENYISDGLNNAELFKRASEFYDVAESEIYKSSELQHSISTTLNNLLVIPKFKPLVKYFKLGNWIRVQVDGKIYKLRLLEYGIDFGGLDSISVEFSDVTKIKNGINDVKSVLSQASSMASSYGAVQRQANQGAKSNSVLNNWVESGLNATQTKIVDSYDENLMFGKNSFWCRQYDPVTDTYSNEQIKIVNSTIAITDDNWETTKTAIGKYYYKDPITDELKTAYGVNGETIVGKFILGEKMSMQNESGSMKFDGNGMAFATVSDDGVGTMTFNNDGLVVSHGDNTVTISPKSKEVMNITNGEDKVFEVNENGELSINGNIIARSLRLENGVKIDSGVITNLATVATSGSYDDLVDTPTKLSDFTNDKSFITNNVSNLVNYYKKTETDNLLSAKANTDALSLVATTGKYADLLDAPILANVATTGDYNDLNNIPEIKDTIEDDVTSPICGKAVLDYALPKKQDVNNAGKLLYVNDSGDITFIDIDELKALLST